MPYDVVMRRTVAQRASSFSRGQRSRLEVFLDSLAVDPNQRGDFNDVDQTGRTNEAKVLHDLMVTYWADHAAREVRIVDLELLDDST